jgi:hypothetical protein
LHPMSCMRNTVSNKGNQNNSTVGKTDQDPNLR